MGCPNILGAEKCVFEEGDTREGRGQKVEVYREGERERDEGAGCN